MWIRRPHAIRCLLAVGRFVRTNVLSRLGFDSPRITFSIRYTQSELLHTHSAGAGLDLTIGISSYSFTARMSGPKGCDGRCLYGTGHTHLIVPAKADTHLKIPTWVSDIDCGANALCVVIATAFWRAVRANHLSLSQPAIRSLTFSILVIASL